MDDAERMIPMATEHPQQRTKSLVPSVERITTSLTTSDLEDLCDATDAAIESGGGFGWVSLPSRDTLERYWQGVIAMPHRVLIIARLGQAVCGAVQLVKPPVNNEAQSFICQLTGMFLAPYARGQGLSRMLMQCAEQAAVDDGFSVMNLDVRQTQGPAIGLYESLGYELIGRHPYYARVKGTVVPGLYYTKMINTRV
jgi:ribosomal protein S18 acetylase RimI-like enzyme